MMQETGIGAKEAVTSIFEKLETVFEASIDKTFEKEVSLTPLLEYGRTKEEFFCSGFTFQTDTGNGEIIFTARRVVRADFGVEYGLRWCNCGPVEEWSGFKFEDHIGFQNNRRWILAKPYQEQLLALGRPIPKEFTLRLKDNRKTYSPDIIQHLTIEILADRIKRA